MNTPRDFDNERHQREWQAQELARHKERLGVDPVADDARVARYRLLARALRHPPLDPLPDDFAAQVVARAERLSRTLDERVEIWLQRTLAALLAVAGAAAATLYGDAWLQALMPRPGSGTLATWALAIGACVGLTFALEHWRGGAERRESR